MAGNHREVHVTLHHRDKPDKRQTTSSTAELDVGKSSRTEPVGECSLLTSPSIGQHAPRPAMSPLPSRFDSLPGNLPETPPQFPCASPSVKTFDPTLGEPANEATGGAIREKHYLLTVQEVAELLRVPVSWVYERTRRRSLDRLPGYRLGKYWRFNQNEVLAWVKRQRGAEHVP